MVSRYQELMMTVVTLTLSVFGPWGSLLRNWLPWTEGLRLFLARAEQSTLTDGTGLYAPGRRGIPQRKTGVLTPKEGAKAEMVYVR